jgi:hypothetical protein
MEIREKLMPRSTKCLIATLLYFLLAFTPLGAQGPDPEFFVPEFFVSLAPSVVTVTQGEAAMLTVTIRCNTSSFAAVKDCNARPKFDLSLSEFPDGMSAQIADGRVGDNTVSIASSSNAKAGSFPVQIKVAAGTTTQVQTFVLNIREAVPAPSVAMGNREPVTAAAGPVLAWEHHVLVAKTPEAFNRMADDLGRDSWELVSVVTRQNARSVDLVGSFRRPKR